VFDADKKVNGNLLQDAETGCAVKDSMGLESVNKMRVEEASVLASEYETDLHSSSDIRSVPLAVQEANMLESEDETDLRSSPDNRSLPLAVLQTNGEFLCSCCGVMMKYARSMKQHLSTHTSLQSLRPHTAQSHETSGKTVNISKDEITQKRPSEELTAYKRLSTLGISADNSKRLQMPENNKDIGISWRCYPCKYCNSICTSFALLQLHRVQMHKPHKCQKCGLVVAGRRKFSQHVRKEHPGQHICKVLVFTGRFSWNLVKNHWCIFPLVIIMSGCFSVHIHISGSMHLHFTYFSEYVACGSGWVLL